MTLPKRPERTAPIPNEPFDSPEVTTIRGPYWEMPLGNGLENDGRGSVQTSGSSPSDPSAMLYGLNGLVGIGTGLQLGAEGELEKSNELSDNYLPYPTEFTLWDAAGCVALNNQAKAPNESFTAARCTENLLPDYGQRVIYYVINPPSVTGKNCIASVWVKRFGTSRRNVQISIDDSGIVNFDLDNPQSSITLFDENCYVLNSFNVQTWTNGWYRCYFNFHVNELCRVNPYFHIRPLNENLISGYSPGDGSGLFLWNAEWRSFT